MVTFVDGGCIELEIKGGSRTAPWNANKKKPRAVWEGEGVLRWTLKHLYSSVRLPFPL